MPKFLSVRLDNIRNKINRAAEKSGRNGSSIALVAVTKTISASVINEALDLGLMHVGENRIQEAMAKRPFIISSGRRPTFHCLGHLQTNKARKAVQLFDVIQSVDSPRLLEVLNRLGHELGKRIRFLIEVKTGVEPTKSGVPFDRLEEMLKCSSQQSNLELKGLMTIAPLGLTGDQTRECFRTVANFFYQHQDRFGYDPILSMGMTDDFEMAIEEGSTMVRIGRGLFGERA